ncbi:S-layer homology domain-containing protein [Cohnella yongneupensis]|uniref:S-layer homology domain-containing protein n=1 Tax=Cohnella yongneupensis TaxID=425006 RepID=A0ABW0QYJ6_9BACL
MRVNRGSSVRVFILLLALLLLTPVGSLIVPSRTAYADSSSSTPQPSASVTLDARLADWVYDNNADMIYAITTATNKLYFLNGRTLAVEKELLVGSQPTDIELYGNQLFIALSGATGIQVVDIATRELGALLPTTGQPVTLAVTNDYLFYRVSDSMVDTLLYKMDRSTGISTSRETGRLGSFVLRANELNHLIYVGETNSSGSDLIAIDYLTDEIVSKSSYDGGYGFGGPYPKILFDGTDVFFGGSRMNGMNLAEIHGKYPRLGSRSYLDAGLLEISGSYIVTEQAVVDKERYVPIANLPYESTKALMDKGSRVYLMKLDYDSDYRNIEAFDLDLTGPANSLTLTTVNEYSIQSDFFINDWVSEDSSPYIYMISSETNELAVVNKSDLTLVDQRYIGSKPASIDLKDGKLYIAFQGETHIGVLDTSDIQGNIQRILVPSNPQKLFVGGTNQIFYWDEQVFNDFKITDGTTVQPVIQNASPYYGGAVYDSSTRTLLAMDSFWFYKVNAETMELTEKTRQPNTCSAYQSPVILEGDSIYHCMKRMDKSDIATVKGTYPEQVLSVFGDLVFSENAIYDKDLYTKKIELPFHIKKAYMSDDGAIYLLTLNNRIYKFSGVDDIRDYYKTMLTPSDIVVIDTGDEPNQLRGHILFRAAKDEEWIYRYSFYFYDKDGNKLEREISASFNQSLENGIQWYSLISADVPDQAVYIGVSAFLKDKVSTPTPEVGVAKKLIWDVPTYFAPTFEFNDEDADPSYVKGTITWTPPMNEFEDLTYSLYFFSEDETIGDAIVQMGGGEDTYAYTLPKTAVPQGALGLAIVYARGEEVAPVFQYLIFADHISNKIPLSDIVIIKYQVAQDSITVNHLQAGDIIRVYNESGYLLITGPVSAGQTSITIRIGSFGSPGERLLITRTSPGKFESDATQVTIPAITNDGGSGGTIGGGGSIIINPPGPVFPGPVLPGPVVPTIPELPNGNLFTVVEVTDKTIASELAGEAYQKTKTVTLRSDVTTSGSEFQLSSNVLDSLSKQAKDGSLVVETPAGSWTIPVQTLLDAIGSSVAGSELTIRIGQAKDGYASNALPAGGQLVGQPMSFEASIIVDGKIKVLDNFSEYVNHELSVTTPAVPLNELAALMYDPVSRKFVPVPAKFAYVNGVLHASMYRKGNSIYAIVRNTMTFKDMPSDKVYADSIQALANRTVLNGFPDGTFKPEAKVTRAEFAAMLIRALGITTSGSASGKVFKDTPSNGWFTPSVEAAVKAGLITGYDDGTFRPNQTITHQEMVTMVVRAMHYAGYRVDTSSSANGFADVPDWAKPHVYEAVQSGLIARSNDPFAFTVNEETTREQSALLLFRALNEIVFK